jgi:hypothetical protein
MLRDLTGSSEHVSLAFVFESEALAIDADDDRVVQDPIEHRHAEHAIADEGTVPTAEFFDEVGERGVFLSRSS